MECSVSWVLVTHLQTYSSPHITCISIPASRRWCHSTTTALQSAFCCRLCQPASLQAAWPAWTAALQVPVISVPQQCQLPLPLSHCWLAHQAQSSQGSREAPAQRLSLIGGHLGLRGDRQALGCGHLSLHLHRSGALTPGKVPWHGSAQLDSTEADDASSAVHAPLFR